MALRATRTAEHIDLAKAGVAAQKRLTSHQGKATGEPIPTL